MQKLMSRTSRTIAQAERRRAARKAKEEWAEVQYYRLQMIRKQKDDRRHLKKVRQEMKEDWYLGPLASNRAYGDNANQYGAFRQDDISAPEKPEFMRRTIWPIVEGDRVVLLKGRNRGKIGRVQRVHKEQDILTVEHINKGYFALEEFQRKVSGDRAVQEHDLPIPYDDVHLVGTIEDPETGSSKDVIVENVKMVPEREGPSTIKRDPFTGEIEYKRYIKGSNIEIPLPPKAEPDHEDHESDTLRITVEENTFIPTLLFPPMPETVIDELRGKYSKFRTRHDEEFLEKVKNTDRQGERMQQLGLRMRTPLQELHALEKEKKAQRPEPQLTEDMLARIGEVMAANGPPQPSSPKTA